MPTYAAHPEEQPLYGEVASEVRVKIARCVIFDQ
jgi:hypothetical protein